jgi:hypothetical protein
MVFFTFFWSSHCGNNRTQADKTLVVQTWAVQTWVPQIGAIKVVPVRQLQNEKCADKCGFRQLQCKHRQYRYAQSSPVKPGGSYRMQAAQTYAVQTTVVQTWAVQIWAVQIRPVQVVPVRQLQSKSSPDICGPNTCSADTFFVASFM